jgi:signal transduction histidine kinase
MNNRILVLFTTLFLGVGIATAEEMQKSELQQRAEAIDIKQNIAGARSLFIHAFNDYANKGRIVQAAECGAKATALYYKENFWKEAFDLLRRVDFAVESDANSTSPVKAAAHYLTARERMQMYMKLRKPTNAMDNLKVMENQATIAGDEKLKNDLLYNKAVYYYTFGQNAEGNAVFKEMADKLTKQKEYGKVDEVYQTLIANGRKSNSASLVAQSYKGYMAWKDSTTALKYADEIEALKKQIKDNEASIAEQDSSLTARMGFIIALGILAGILAAVLVVGGVVLLRYILLTRKQQKDIQMLTDSNALKAQFISNIAGQLQPTFRKLDGNNPDVKALLDFSEHIQTLSQIENSMDEGVELEDTQISPFCEALADQIRDKVRKDVVLHVNAPKMSASINKEYVSRLLLHLLNNAAEYTPEEGTIVLEFKKRSAHTLQFLVSNTGSSIPEEKRDDVFKPFLEVRDLTKGDGLGLPICKQMARKMNGDLEIDPEFTKGVRFVLELHV